jgi:hypothetical protein
VDDFAAAPAQRTSDDGGRTLPQKLAARKKAVKKVQPAPVRPPAPEPEPATDPEADHQLDVLG